MHLQCISLFDLDSITIYRSHSHSLFAFDVHTSLRYSESPTCIKTPIVNHRVVMNFYPFDPYMSIGDILRNREKNRIDNSTPQNDSVHESAAAATANERKNNQQSTDTQTLVHKCDFESWGNLRFKKSGSHTRRLHRFSYIFYAFNHVKKVHALNYSLRNHLFFQSFN